VAEAAGEKHVELFGASIARQAIEAGLLDEIVVHVAPVLLGDGVRLYGGSGAPRVDLQRTTLEDRGNQVSVRYRPRR
jgi:riboflavin biosynthesis pyrimidine reductase